jgi:hypothetical protein
MEGGGRDFLSIFEAWVLHGLHIRARIASLDEAGDGLNDGYFYVLCEDEIWRGEKVECDYGY